MYPVRTNGPLPTTGNVRSLVNSARSPVFDQMCRGTIGTSSAAIVACGFFSRITSRVALGAVTSRKLVTKLPFAVAASSSVIIVVKVQAASRAVTGLPSDQRAFSRMVYVQVSLSDEGFHAVASPGTGRLSAGS